MIKTDDLEKNAYVRGAAATPAKDQISKKEDNIHYSAKGQIQMGVRFAQAYLSSNK